MEFKCNLCDKTCPNMENLKQHTLMCITTRYEENVEGCDATESMNVVQYSDEVHNTIDESTNKQSIKLEETLREEDATSIIEGNENKLSEETVIKASFDRAKCDQYSKICANEINLKNHVARVHAGKQTKNKICIKEVENNQAICDFCAKVLSNSKNLRLHIQNRHTEHTKIQCEFCAKDIKSTYIHMHIKDMHSTNSKNKNIQCVECGKILSNKTNLKLHMNTVHVEASTVVCEQCSKYVKSTNMKNHVKEMHVNHVDTPCPLCGKIFARRKLMTDHKRNVHATKKCHS